MSLLSWPVLLGGALIASPALWAAFVDGTLSPTTALVRLGLCLAGVWVALSVAESLADGAGASGRRTPPDPDVERPADVDLG